MLFPFRETYISENRLIQKVDDDIRKPYCAVYEGWFDLF